MSAELDIINRVLTLFNQDNVTTLEETSSEISKYMSILATQHRQHQTMSNMYTNLSLLEIQKNTETNEFPVSTDVLACLTRGYVIRNHKLVEVDPIPHYAREYGGSTVPLTGSFFLPYKVTSMYPRVTVIVRRLMPLDETSDNYRDMLAYAVALEHYSLTGELTRIDVFNRLYTEALQKVQKEELNYKNLNLQSMKNYGRV